MSESDSIREYFDFGYHKYIYHIPSPSLRIPYLKQMIIFDWCLSFGFNWEKSCSLYYYMCLFLTKNALLMPVIATIVIIIAIAAF